MGLAASQARLLMLTARKSDLEFTGQQINQARIQLANISNQLIEQINGLLGSLDPDDPAVVALQFQISSLQSLDKGLELQLRRVDTQQQSVLTEVEAVRKVIDQNIEATFKTFA